MVNLMPVIRLFLAIPNIPKENNNLPESQGHGRADDDSILLWFSQPPDQSLCQEFLTGGRRTKIESRLTLSRVLHRSDIS